MPVSQRTPPVRTKKAPRRVSRQQKALPTAARLRAGPKPPTKISSEDSYDDESQESQIEACSFADAFGWVKNRDGHKCVMLDCNNCGFYKYVNLKEMLSYANPMDYLTECKNTLEGK